MIRNLLVLVLLASAAGPASGQEPGTLPFTLPTPEGWRTETLPFPLSFAPELEYTGLEELRFSPGMFDAESEQFWTYAFVWWIPLGTELKPAKLAADLEAYFRGLARAVAASQEFDPGELTVSARAEALPSADAAGPFHLEVEAYDAFVTRGPVRLGGRVEVVRCSAQQRQAVVFEFSPQPESHGVWSTLGSIREGFRCGPPGGEE